MTYPAGTPPFNSPAGAQPHLQRKPDYEHHYRHQGRNPALLQGLGHRPIVFSHGWPLNSDSWEAQMLFLASRGYRCVAHDRRGHGRSIQPWGGHEMNTYADDLAAVMDKLDLKKAMMVGFSTGGKEVARYIGRHDTERLRPDGRHHDALDAVLRASRLGAWRVGGNSHRSYAHTHVLNESGNALEKLNEKIPLHGLRWSIEHAETISPLNIARVKALGGGIALDTKMALHGDGFIKTHGRERLCRPHACANSSTVASRWP